VWHKGVLCLLPLCSLNFKRLFVFTVQSRHCFCPPLEPWKARRSPFFAAIELMIFLLVSFKTFTKFSIHCSRYFRGTKDSLNHVLCREQCYLALFEHLSIHCCLNFSRPIFCINWPSHSPWNSNSPSYSNPQKHEITTVVLKRLKPRTDPKQNPRKSFW